MSSTINIVKISMGMVLARFPIEEGGKSEALRLGEVFLDRKYYKTYRRISLEQFKLAVEYVYNLDSSKYLEVDFESCIGLPASSFGIDDNEISQEEMWNGSVIATDDYYELCKFAHANGYTCPIGTGTANFVSCILEGILPEDLG